MNLLSSIKGRLRHYVAGLVLGRSDGCRFDRKLTHHSGAHEVRDGMDPINSVPHLDESCEEVEFPQPGIKTRCLKLFYEIPIWVFIPVHHWFGDTAGRRKAF